MLGNAKGGGFFADTRGGSILVPVQKISDPGGLPIEDGGFRSLVPLVPEGVVCCFPHPSDLGTEGIGKILDFVDGQRPRQQATIAEKYLIFL